MVDVKLKLIGIILLVLVSVMALGCVESQPSAPSQKQTTYNPTQAQVKTTVLITASPSQMLPTINDMPDGSMRGSEFGNDTYANRDFVFTTGIMARILSYGVYKFSSTTEAIDKYNSIKNEESNYKLKNVGLGDESFGFEVADTIATVVFRKTNVVVKVTFAGRYSANLEDTVSYAKLVKTPISTLKLVADTKTLTKGETWNLGGGYALKVMVIDQKASPKNVWLQVNRNGNKLDDYVSSEGKTYSYGNILTTKIESISDTEIVLRDTYVIS